MKEEKESIKRNVHFRRLLLSGIKARIARPTLHFMHLAFQIKITHINSRIYTKANLFEKLNLLNTTRQACSFLGPNELLRFFHKRAATAQGFFKKA